MSYNRDRDEDDSYGSSGRRNQGGYGRDKEDEDSYGSGRRNQGSGIGRDREEESYGSGRRNQESSGYVRDREESSYGSSGRNNQSSGYGREREEESSYGSSGRNNQYSGHGREREEDSSRGSGRRNQESSGYGRDREGDSYGSTNRRQSPSRHEESGSGVPFRSPFGSSNDDDRSRGNQDSERQNRERSQGRGRNDSTTLGATLSSSRLDNVDWQETREQLGKVAESEIRTFTKAVEKSGRIQEEEERNKEDGVGKGDSAFAKRLREEKSDIQALREDGAKGKSTIMEQPRYSNRSIRRYQYQEDYWKQTQGE